MPGGIYQALSHINQIAKVNALIRGEKACWRPFKDRRLGREIFGGFFETYLENEDIYGDMRSAYNTGHKHTHQHGKYTAENIRKHTLWTTMEKSDFVGNMFT